MDQQPVTSALFVSHGAPSLILESSPSRDFLSALAGRLGRPRAIVCVSAHWESERVAVNLNPKPETIHDFGGFPDELYRMQYPAPGDPVLGDRILKMLHGAGIDNEGDNARGIDHGVWSPLKLIFPEAAIPVVEISVQPRRDAAHHLAVGRALAPLREENILIVGSGSTTHNLRELGRLGAAFTEFESWVCEAVVAGRVEDLTRFEQKAPYAKRNHPTPEHFLPLFAPLGAAGENAKGEALNRHFEYGSLSMAAFLWP